MLVEISATQRGNMSQSRRIRPVPPTQNLLQTLTPVHLVSFLPFEKDLPHGMARPCEPVRGLPEAFLSGLRPLWKATTIPGCVVDTVPTHVGPTSLFPGEHGWTTFLSFPVPESWPIKDEYSRGAPPVC